MVTYTEYTLQKYWLRTFEAKRSEAKQKDRKVKMKGRTQNLRRGDKGPKERND